MTGRFDPGDLVHDRDTPPGDRGTMVVLRTIDEPADRYEFKPGQTVASVNAGEYASDLVVEVVYEGWLRRHVPEWRGLLDDVRTLPGRTFHEHLGEYAQEWGVPKQTYHYPEGRLTPRPWCYGCGWRADRNVPETTAEGDREFIAEWVCGNPDCGDPQVVQDDARNADDEPPEVVARRGDA